MSDRTERIHVCEFCEAGCGLVVDLLGGRAVGVRANEADVLSKGFICPKGLSLLALEDDPDRLRTPVQKRPDGTFEPISWDLAFDVVTAHLRRVQELHGRDAVAVYMGTPMVHKHGALLMRGALLGALRTKNCTSAGSQDSSPRFAASYYLYGSTFSTPVPDIDRTDYFLCVGANPLVSNGSFLTAPNIRARLQAIRDRGGKVVVVDPRRTETARAADEHVSIVPGTDAAFLLAMTQVLLEERRIDERALYGTTRGWPELRQRLSAFTPERTARLTGVPAGTTRRLALEFASAPTSAAYARLGVCNSAFGTVGSYAVDVLNIVAGRLGRVGGSMFPSPAIDLPLLARLTSSDGHARWHSRVRGLPETAGDLPSAILAEEMETPGEGQVRAFISFAGNPVLSTPDGLRLARALSKLDFMVSVDHYVNETTRFADVILPPCSPSSDDHVDLFFASFAARDGIRWTPPPVPRREDERADWEILLELAFRLGGGPTGIAPVDALFRLGRRLGLPVSPDDTVELALRAGPYGDHFLPWKKGLTGKAIRDSVHGVDLGPLKPGVERRVYHRDGLVDLAPPLLMSALAGFEAELSRERSENELLLVGRRDIRSNNSWMHNLPRLVSGKDRCVLFVNPRDGERLGLTDGGAALLESRVHQGEVPVRFTDEVRPGVVSLPHGHGHRPSAATQRVAAEKPGVSANDWTSADDVEAVVGQSILNGVRVRLHPVASAGAVAAE